MKLNYLEESENKLPWYYGYSHEDSGNFNFVAYYYPIPINKIVSLFKEIWMRLKYNRSYFKYTIARFRGEVLSLEKQIEELREQINDLVKS